MDYYLLVHVGLLTDVDLVLSQFLQVASDVSIYKEQLSLALLDLFKHRILFTLNRTHGSLCL